MTVYPAYIAVRVSQAIQRLIADGDQKLDQPILQSVGIMEAVGDCRYEIPVTDHNGTKYKITVEVL